MGVKSRSTTPKSHLETWQRHRMACHYGKPFSHLINICRYLQIITDILQIIADICKCWLYVKTACHNIGTPKVQLIQQQHSESANRRRQNLNRKVIWKSNSDFGINPHPDVCWICPKMLWMRYLVGVSYFVKYGTNQPLTVWEMLTNVQKFPIPQWWRKWKSDPESIGGSHYHQKLITSSGSPLAYVYQVWLTSVSAFVSYPVYRMTERMTERQNDHAEVIRHAHGWSESVAGLDCIVTESESRGKRKIDIINTQPN